MVDALQDIAEGIVKYLAEVLSKTTGQAVRVMPAAGVGDIDWQVRLAVSGIHRGTLVAGVTMQAAERMTAAVLNGGEGFADAEVADSLKELLTQASVRRANQTDGLKIVVSVPERAPLTPPAAAWHHDLAMEGDAPPRLTFWTEASPDDAASAPQPEAPPPVVQRTADVLAMRQIVGEHSGATDDAPPRNLDVVLDLELPITVRFGQTRLTLDALARLGPGSLIDLERSPDDPVELLVNGRLVARGEVVVVAGCYGIRVREVVSAADRLRTLEA